MLCCSCSSLSLLLLLLLRQAGRTGTTPRVVGMWGGGSTDCHRIETSSSHSNNYIIITSYSSFEGITCSALAAGVYDQHEYHHALHSCKYLLLPPHAPRHACMSFFTYQNHPGSSETSLLVPSSLCSWSWSMIHHHHAKDLSSTVVSQSFGQLSWTRGCNLAAKTFLKSSLNLNVEKHAKKIRYNFHVKSLSRFTAHG